MKKTEPFIKNRRTYSFIFIFLLIVFLASCSSAKPLTKAEAARQAENVQAQWMDSIRVATDDVFTKKEVREGDLVMPLAWTVYAPEGADDLALYISLHGGGGAPAQLNDGQWRNQQVLYRPQNAVYLCPRAPFNTWDLHFKPELDEFYHRIIMMAVSHLHVNPNKVYVMGYSAGGDGVWRLGPRMADTWAAASMMAGHPGDVSLVSLRNTPFMIWCGANDAAYNRNAECAERIAQMDSLHRADPEGYTFEGHIVPDKGHWMDRVDTAAVTWMVQYTRNPYPRRIVWQQGDALHEHFYWLSAPADELAKGKEVRAELDGNTIRITRCDYTSLTLSLSDAMLDLDQPVRVVCQDKTLYEGRAERRASTLRHTLSTRGDPAYLFPAQIHVRLR